MRKKLVLAPIMMTAVLVAVPVLSMSYTTIRKTHVYQIVALACISKPD